MSTTTELKLLTLLNVSAIKRPRPLDIPGGHRGSPSTSRSSSAVPNGGESGASPVVKAKTVTSNGSSGLENISKGAAKDSTEPPAKRRRSVVFGGEVGPSGSYYPKKGKGKGKEKEGVKGKAGEVASVNGSGVVENGDGEGDEEIELESDEEAETGVDDNFLAHFGPAPEILNEGNIGAASGNEWDVSRRELKGYGRVVEMVPRGSVASEGKKNRIIPSLTQALRQKGANPLVNTALSHLGSYKDIYLHSLDGEADGTEKQMYGDQKEAMRQAAMVHAMNHVLKTRRRIIRNNEKLAKDPNIDPPRDTSFTRPKILLLVPVRSLALHYILTHLVPLAPAGTQIENLKPFTNSFSIPADVQDPLATAEASSSFAIDHLVNFRGNSDDNFRFGIKITRKAWRIVMPPANESKLLDCDILVASPLGIKMAAEKEGSTDLLSSIEVGVVDGVDAMQMQNWEHVQFVFDNLNKIPDSPHGCDFSRVKPWYLDNQAKYLRQTLILSRYDTPEARVVFHRQCHNVQGKMRLEKTDLQGVLGQVRPGVKKIFDRIDLEGAKGPDGAVEEVEQRLQWFTKKTIPALLKSAVMRQNTIIVVPSYFDFVRLNNHLRKSDQVSYAAISEYSSNSEISRARTLFFKGKKSFLLVTERFHFYRRYMLRGAKTIVFYSLPDHAQFYAEFMKTPFLPGRNGQGELVDVDEGEVSARVLFSRFDVLKLERVVGSENARQMLNSGEGRSEFV